MKRNSRSIVFATQFAVGLTIVSIAACEDHPSLPTTVDRLPRPTHQQNVAEISHRDGIWALQGDAPTQIAKAIDSIGHGNGDSGGPVFVRVEKLSSGGTRTCNEYCAVGIITTGSSNDDYCSQGTACHIGVSNWAGMELVLGTTLNPRTTP